MNKFILLAMLAVLSSPVFARGGGGGGGGHASAGGHSVASAHPTASAHATAAESAHVSTTSAHESVSTAHESTSTSSGFNWSWFPHWPRTGHVSSAAPASGTSEAKVK